MLLFKEGDPWSESTAAESARILRSLGIINPVTITAHRVEGGVESHGRDPRPLDPAARRAGRCFRAAAPVSDSMSRRTTSSAGASRWASTTSPTTSATGWSYNYFDPNVFKTRWRLNLDPRQSLRWLPRRDHRRSPVLFAGHPLDLGRRGRTRRSESSTCTRSRVGGHRIPEQRSCPSLGRRTTSGKLPHHTPRDCRLGAPAATFTGTGSGRSSGAPYPPPEDLLIEGPSLAYQQISDHFVVVEGFRAWTVQEDVALGPNFCGRHGVLDARDRRRPTPSAVRPQRARRPPKGAMAGARRCLDDRPPREHRFSRPGRRHPDRRRPTRPTGTSTAASRRNLERARQQPSAHPGRRPRPQGLGPGLFRRHRARPAQHPMAKADQRGRLRPLLVRRCRVRGRRGDVGPDGSGPTPMAFVSTPVSGCCSISPTSAAPTCCGSMLPSRMTAPVQPSPSAPAPSFVCGGRAPNSRHFRGELPGAITGAPTE